jgi:hypothetical protein
MDLLVSPLVKDELLSELIMYSFVPREIEIKSVPNVA